MGIHLDSHCAYFKSFLFRVFVDLPTQLVRPFAVHAPRPTFPFRLDLAQPLKEEDTARIPGADSGNLARHQARRIIIKVSDVPPKLLVAVLAFDWLA